MHSVCNTFSSNVCKKIRLRVFLLLQRMILAFVFLHGVRSIDVNFAFNKKTKHKSK